MISSRFMVQNINSRSKGVGGSRLNRVELEEDIVIYNEMRRRDGLVKLRVLMDSVTCSVGYDYVLNEMMKIYYK